MYVLSKSIHDYTRYFMLPEKVLLLKLPPTLRMAIVVCFMLRDRASYRLKNVVGLSRSIQKYLGLSVRRSKAIVQQLIEAAYIKRDGSGFELLPHPDFEHFWADLPKRAIPTDSFHPAPTLTPQPIIHELHINVIPEPQQVVVTRDSTVIHVEKPHPALARLCQSQTEDPEKVESIRSVTASPRFQEMLADLRANHLATSR